MEGREVVVPEGEGAPATPAFAVLPEGATRGVVVIHELYGRQPEIDRVVMRFANAGYAAVAPDLFHRGRTACLFEVFRALRSGKETIAAQQGRNARAWLRAESGLPEAKVGLIGFCFGGAYALLCGSGWGAVSTNYGYVPAAEVMRGIGPVIGCYGARDKVFPDGRILCERLAQVGVAPEVHVFQAGHSFLTDGHHPIASRLVPQMSIGDYPEAREAAWTKILAFLERHLS